MEHSESLINKWVKWMQIFIFMCFRHGPPSDPPAVFAADGNAHLPVSHSQRPVWMAPANRCSSSCNRITSAWGCSPGPSCQGCSVWDGYSWWEISGWGKAPRDQPIRELPLQGKNWQDCHPVVQVSPSIKKEPVTKLLGFVWGFFSDQM